MRSFRSDGYNWYFNTKTGFFARWGKNTKDNPDFSPVGPEILDIEISTICNKGCKHCYKSNTGKGRNMSLKTFKKLFNTFPSNLTQIAFGIGDIDGNPDLWKIMKYCRKNGIIPNITVNGRGITNAHAKKLASVCGAVAVSHYDDNSCFNTVKKLCKAGLKQVNIHQLVAKETFEKCLDVCWASQFDDRLKDLKAIVFLGLKKKGRGIEYNPLEKEKFDYLVNWCLGHKVNMGFDSCSAHKFLDAIKDHPHYEHLEQMVEPCESSCFSYYINVDGVAYPCSFLEGEEGYEGVDLLKTNSFFDDLWFSTPVKNFRKALIDNKRGCLRYEI